jgi:hypothetical protein
VTDLNTRLCERLRALDMCPACGSFRTHFHAADGMAVAIYACGADMMVSAGTFVIEFGCKNKVADALGVIKAEEEGRS